MDQLALLKNLDRAASVFRSIGLSPLPSIGKRILKSLMGTATVSINTEGFEVNGSFEHRHYLDALQRGKVEAFMVKLFRSVVQPGMVVLDIGGFVGWYTLLAAREVGPHGKVFVFEPDPRNYALLIQNLRENGFSDRVVPVPKAVSDRIGTVSFFMHEGDQSRSSLIPSNREVAKTNVESIILDEYLANEIKIDVIKMDIEGAELHALAGMERILARADVALKMFVECNPLSLQLAGGSAQTLIRRLRELGFIIMIIDEQNDRLAPVDSTIETAKYVNLYCCRRNETCPG
jgi:FkbM family methyltransferase